MTGEIPCTRHDRAGTSDSLLREILADAGKRTGRDLADAVRSLYDYDGRLLATWSDKATRESLSSALTAAWRERMGEAAVLHLITSDDEYDYQEDVLENSADT